MAKEQGSDKRSVSTDALETLGTFLDDTQKRDAIHLAVEPVIAGKDLEPGQHITVEDGIAKAALRGRGLGIVDPFLPRSVKRGERFWFVMYPRMVKSLRHVWTHPAFKDEPLVGAPPVPAPAQPTNEMSVKWLEEYADSLELTYVELVGGAISYLDGGHYIVLGFSGHELDSDFWVHFEIVTGRKVPQEKRGSFFSCSC